MLDVIQDYLRRHRRACLADVAAAAGAPAEAVRPMLELLAARGRVRPLTVTDKQCGGCTRCPPEALTVWEWTGDEPSGRDEGRRDRPRGR